jgi:hypothetical protein
MRNLAKKEETSAHNATLQQFGRLLRCRSGLRRALMRGAREARLKDHELQAD